MKINRREIIILITDDYSDCNGYLRICWTDGFVFIFHYDSHRRLGKRNVFDFSDFSTITAMFGNKQTFYRYKETNLGCYGRWVKLNVWMGFQWKFIKTRRVFTMLLFSLFRKSYKCGCVNYSSWIERRVRVRKTRGVYGYYLKDSFYDWSLVFSVVHEQTNYWHITQEEINKIFTKYKLETLK